MNLIKKLGIIAIGAALMAGCTPKADTAKSSNTETTAAESGRYRECKSGGYRQHRDEKNRSDSAG